MGKQEEPVVRAAQELQQLSTRSIHTAEWSEKGNLHLTFSIDYSCLGVFFDHLKDRPEE